MLLTGLLARSEYLQSAIAGPHHDLSTISGLLDWGDESTSRSTAVGLKTPGLRRVRVRQSGRRQVLAGHRVFLTDKCIEVELVLMYYSRILWILQGFH